MNKRQSKKALKNTLRHELQMAGMAVLAQFGYKNPWAAVGDAMLMEKLKHAYVEVLKRHMPKARPQIITVHFNCEAWK